MASNDNSVNIKSYHHGDLRTALVEEGLRQLAASDAGHLSLRELARNVGVSATAVYRHFPDKQALLSALASAGSEELERQQRCAYAAAGEGMAGFEEAGRQYVRFAIANPALFRLMMTDARFCSKLDADETRVHSLGFLWQTVETLSAPGTNERAIRARAAQAWSIAHGLAMLILDGQIPADDALINAVVSAPFAKPHPD